MNRYNSRIFPVFLLFISKVLTEIVESETGDVFKIEGRVEVVSATEKDWIANTQVVVDGGDYVAHLRGDGSFVLNGLPSGTYVVEVLNPTYLFEATRVDITSKGKMRARRVNYLQPSVVKTMHYPLEFRDRRKANYFQKREQWKITDFLMNPMVLTMVLPLVLIMILPKMMNAADPEAQKEMQSQMKALNDKSSLPDMSEMLAGWLGGGSSSKSGSKQKQRR
ncbi:ER membrane protein complex subunit 7-like [Mercenaria mercenaria]|uniref:ER membrane protein complex subunit 7-like n=1 Tax=Mercenaria mercenaria TaxID=6596 RepID=UPI00234E5B9F|nr:ER membrane protein complex subunit 7-like [Mercenaria mercenaria]